MGVNLLCVDKSKAQKLLEKIHAGLCGPHMNGTMLAKKIVRMAYYVRPHPSRLLSVRKDLPEVPNL